MSSIFFTLNVRAGMAAFAMQDQYVELATLNAAAAWSLWCSGCAYLHITRAGAAHFLRRQAIAKSIELLRSCKTLQEVNALRAVHPRSASLVAACKRRASTIRHAVVRF